MTLQLCHSYFKECQELREIISGYCYHTLSWMTRSGTEMLLLSHIQTRASDAQLKPHAGTLVLRDRGRFVRLCQSKRTGEQGL